MTFAQLHRALFCGCTSTLLCAAIAPAAFAQGPSANPTHEWETAPGLRIDVAATGFTFPTAIAFIPSPGQAPDDPLYFVAELNGSIKVVSHNGAVSEFASGFAPFVRSQPLPINRGENGTAGLCLDPVRGYVFVTYVYQDSAGILRNGMARFSTRPRTFARTPTALVSFDSIFATDRSTDSHQIGPCVVAEDLVYVAVGDGQQGEPSQRLDLTLGKILRMTIDGGPPPGNPFKSPVPGSRAHYVWASGLRNVFSLTTAKGRLFAAENGLNVDRWFEVERARNYLWAGNDWTIGMNAAMVFAPAVSPVQMVFATAADSALPPEFREHFIVALSGRAGEPGPGTVGEKSIVALDYDFSTRQVRAMPQPIVRFRGSGRGNVVSVAVGPDGLYFAPLFPSGSATSPMLRVSRDSINPHPFGLGSSNTATSLIQDFQCLGCHVLNNRGGSFGPDLNAPGLAKRLRARLDSATYRERLLTPDPLHREPFTSMAPTRQAIVDAPSLARPRLWLVNWLMEPRFESPAPAMPSLGLNRAQAEILADSLLSEPTLTWRQIWAERIPRPRRRHVPFAFVIGFACAALLFGTRLRWSRR